MKPLLISVVIATYRRPAMLRDTVLSLTTIEVPPSAELEVIVIDNDPEGGARAAAAELARACRERFALRYVHEQRTGLSYARNRGIEESRGEIVAFLDDDVFVDAQWLVSLLVCFAGTPADCVGGRTLVHWEGEPDAVLKACETQLFAIDLGTRDHEVCGAKLPGGGNAAFRRRVFEPGFRFATDLGRVGKVLLSSEDTDLFLRLRRSGGRIWYCAGASVRHRTGGERLNRAYVVRQKYWFGISYAVADRKVYGTAAQACLAAARLVKLVLIVLPQLTLAKLSGNRPGELLAQCALVKQLGYLRATIWPVVVETRSPSSSAAPAVAASRT